MQNAVVLPYAQDVPQVIYLTVLLLMLAAMVVHLLLTVIIVQDQHAPLAPLHIYQMQLLLLIVIKELGVQQLLIVQCVVVILFAQLV